MAIKIGGPATSEIARYAAAKSPPEAVEGLRNLAAEDRGLGLGGLGPLTWDVWYIVHSYITC